MLNKPSVLPRLPRLDKDNHMNQSKLLHITSGLAGRTTRVVGLGALISPRRWVDLHDWCRLVVALTATVIVAMPIPAAANQVMQFGTAGHDGKIIVNANGREVKVDVLKGTLPKDKAGLIWAALGGNAAVDIEVDLAKGRVSARGSEGSISVISDATGEETKLVDEGVIRQSLEGRIPFSGILDGLDDDGAESRFMVQLAYNGVLATADFGSRGLSSLSLDAALQLIFDQLLDDLPLSDQAALRVDFLNDTIRFAFPDFSLLPSITVYTSDIGVSYGLSIRVPEPSTLALLSLAIAAAAAASRRRRRYTTV